MPLTTYDDFRKWYNISGSLYVDEQSAWYLWQTVIAFLDKNEKERDSNEA